MMSLVLVSLTACAGSKSQEKAEPVAPEETMTDEEYGEAMGEQHSGETPRSSGAALAMGAKGIPTEGKENVAYGTVGGKQITGYYVAPTTEGTYPGLIMIHEWWGLNDNIRDMANSFAARGYRVLAVDMYGDQVATTPDKAKQYMTAAMSNPDDGKENLRQAREFLEAKGSPRIGAIGWCFGGGWSLEAGLQQGKDLDAIVMYYGRVKTTEAELATLEAPLLGLFGAKDEGIPVAQVRAFEEALDEADKDAKIVIYDEAGHAFANPSGDKYVESAAADSWARTLGFLEEHLRDD